jgi:hypothetical protein
VLHVLTVHHRTQKWIDIQLDFLARHVSEPYITFASLEGIDERVAARFDVTVPSLGPHAGKLNHLAAVASGRADQDDLLMFIDGDAFPIADPMPLVHRELASSALVAVRRDENLRDRQPHPSFAVTTASTWRRLHGDWSSGHPWPIEEGRLVSDVGGNLLYLLEATSTPWSPLLRSNRRNLHPLFFGVYGDIVYHHGAGFRVPFSRRDAAGNPFPARSAQRKRWRRRRERRNRELADDVYRRIQDDADFYRDVCGVDPG